MSQFAFIQAQVQRIMVDRHFSVVEDTYRPKQELLDDRYLDILWPASRLNTSGEIYSTDGTGLKPPIYHLWMRDEAGAKSHKTINGSTFNAAGAALSGVVVDAFTTADDIKQGTATSLADGSYSIATPSAANHYLVAYKTGSPDLAGTTVNNIAPI